MPEVSTPMDEFVEMLDSQAQIKNNIAVSPLVAFAKSSGLSDVHQIYQIIEDSRRTYSWLSWYRGSFGFPR